MKQVEQERHLLYLQERQQYSRGAFLNTIQGIFMNLRDSSQDSHSRTRSNFSGCLSQCVNAFV